MKVVVEYRNKKILEKYNNKYYVRFYGGMMEEDEICEFPITQEQVDNAITDSSLIKEYVRQEQGKLLWVE